MDFNSSTKMKDARTPTPHPVKTTGKWIEAEDRAGKQVFDSHDRQKPLPRPGLSLGKKNELEQQRRHVLNNEHNRLTFAMKRREAKLKELQELLKANNLLPNSEDTVEQCIRQLENNLDKMKMKITEARKIQIFYQPVHEHLQQEVCGLSKVLDQRELAVAVRQAEVDKATIKLQSAAAAADSAQARMVQVEYAMMERRREIDSELCELSAEEKLKRKMETLKCRQPTAQSRQIEWETEEEEEEEEEKEADSTSVKDYQCFDICGASQSDMKLVEDVEALREALGCADVQDLINKVVSQQAINEQLILEVTQCEELIKQEAKTLAHLESQCTELKFSVKPTATRSDRLKEQMQARLSQELERVKRLQAELKQSQGLLDTIERWIDNLYFRMSCVPVEGLPSASSADSMDKLRDISARLPTLRQRASEKKPEISGQDQEKLYSVLEQLNMMELRNNKRPTTPIDIQQLSDDEDECSPSREEIKRNSLKLIESNQNKKSSRTARK